MALSIDENGTIEIYQGDSGTVYVHGLNSAKKYRVYMAIYDKNRNLIADELQEEANYVEFVHFDLLPSLTNLLTVPPKKDSETYYYGFKANEVGTDKADTLFVANGTYGDLNEIIVYPKKVKGYVG